MQLRWQPTESIVCLLLAIGLSFLYGQMLWIVPGLALAALVGVGAPIISRLMRRKG